MPAHSKATNEQLQTAYADLGNVWRVAELFGMCGQSVHERLAKIGAVRPLRVFTDQERTRLLNDYEKHAKVGRLDALAAEMGRTKQYLCRQAKALGLTDQKRGTPWNVGNTTMKDWLKENPHPRGMLGKHHNWTDEQTTERSRKTFCTMMERYGTTTLSTGENRSWRAGWREVAGRRVYFRSRWEANYGRYLQWLKERGVIREWEHEPETFWFEQIRRGARSYLPDFRVTDLSGALTYHEVKGWMDARSKTKINRMRIYHKTVRLIVIEAKVYRKIEGAVSGLIPEWEPDR